jgi:endo-1,4-beta-D-glucanase Y
MHLMRWMAKHMPDPAWGKILISSRKVVLGSAPKGFAPDWIMFKANKGFEPDVTGEAFGQGAYNAIRVYLWAGLMHTADANTKALLEAFAPMARYVAKQGFPPEAIDIQTGTGLKAGPSGFSAAMLPFLAAKGDKAALQAQQNRIGGAPDGNRTHI